jgi:cytochrome c peroxidase
MKKPFIVISSAILSAAVVLGLSSGNAAAGLSPIEELGKKLFFDQSLSNPAGQDCGACHGPYVGFTGPDERSNKAGGIYEGVVRGRFGNRKPPAASYAGDSPKLHIDKDGNFVGGMFWDGRATGDALGDPLAEQAMGPFMNPLEQNMPDKESIVLAVQKSNYASLFELVWGKGSLDAGKNVDKTYESIARAIAAYERSPEVNSFSSKFDAFWQAARAKGLKVETIDATNAKNYSNLGLTDREVEGLVLFNTKGFCLKCHVLTSVNGKPPVFTDYSYDNIGVPKNPQNPFYGQAKKYNSEGKNWVDKGLGGFLETREKYKNYASVNLGKHKVPTLRNVDKRPSPGFVKAFMHNGYFTSLKNIVHFYNTRDLTGAKWPAPEVRANLNTEEVGNLGLSDDEENAIVDFMKTLTDMR